MELELVDPTQYPSWDSLLLQSQDHSFFHSSAWAKVLIDSYGYRATYTASIENGSLVFLMPLMEVVSLLTGKRGVSLPFTDACPVFDDNSGALPRAIREAMDLGKARRWRYIEWRGADLPIADAAPSEAFLSHDISLLGTENDLFASLESSNRRGIRKAMKSGVVAEISRSWDSMASFYRLQCLTRQRHGLPPQSLAFFKNVYNSVILKDLGHVVTATLSGRMIAASVFFHFGGRAIYKYGASDLAYQEHRPNNLTMWEAMNWYRGQGFESLNLGRTEEGNQGLIRYKRLWGGRESRIEYHRYDLRNSRFLQMSGKRGALASRLFAHMPKPALRLAGRLLYKHFG